MLEVYEFVEAEGFLYAIRLPGNQVLQKCIGASFAVRNPNATSSCGCGVSFSI